MPTKPVNNTIIEYYRTIGLERIRALASKAGLRTFEVRVGGKRRVTRHVLGDLASRSASAFKLRVQLIIIEVRTQQRM
jgi:hypothetical protein